MRMKHWNRLPREVVDVLKIVGASFQPKPFYDIVVGAVVVIIIIIIPNFSPKKRKLYFSGKILTWKLHVLIAWKELCIFFLKLWGRVDMQWYCFSFMHPFDLFIILARLTSICRFAPSDMQILAFWDWVAFLLCLVQGYLLARICSYWTVSSLTVFQVTSEK